MANWIRRVRNVCFVAVLIATFAVQVQDVRADHCLDSGGASPVCDSAWAQNCVYDYDPCGQNAQATCDALCQSECGSWYATSVITCESGEWAPEPWRASYIECYCQH